VLNKHQTDAKLGFYMVTVIGWLVGV